MFGFLSLWVTSRHRSAKNYKYGHFQHSSSHNTNAEPWKCEIARKNWRIRWLLIVMVFECCSLTLQDEFNSINIIITGPSCVYRQTHTHTHATHTSTYLSQEQRPQHLPRSVRFFSASFISELIWSKPSSIRSNCSMRGCGGAGWRKSKGERKQEMRLNVRRRMEGEERRREVE